MTAVDRFDSQAALSQLFWRLKKRDFRLGVAEYQSGLEAVAAEFAVDEEAFLEMVGTLWCHRREQQVWIRQEWATLKKEMEARSDEPKFPKNLDRGSESSSSEDDQLPEPDPDRQEPQQSQDLPSNSTLSALPIQAPRDSAPEMMLDLRANFPLSKRSMIYGWRSLKRMVADGSPTLLDEAATVAAYVNQGGIYTGPVYRRRSRNAARLVLLVDQNGSMVPFHRFTRDLVETAQSESPLEPENVRVVYFQNVPGEYVYDDRYLTEPIELAEVLADCDADTSVLVVSDGGAARGYRRQERIQATTRRLRQIKRRSQLLAWLNPFSEARWQGSSAEILRYLVPMFAMDRIGFGDAIDVLRGVRVPEDLV
jgi:uncharacterized protein